MLRHFSKRTVNLISFCGVSAILSMAAMGPTFAMEETEETKLARQVRAGIEQKERDLSSDRYDNKKSDRRTAPHLIIDFLPSSNNGWYGDEIPLDIALMKILGIKSYNSLSELREMAKAKVDSERDLCPSDVISEFKES